MENLNIEEYIKDLSPELQEKARSCSNIEELISLARENKVPLPDDALEAVAGGKGNKFKDSDRFHVYREYKGGVVDGKPVYLYTVYWTYQAWYKFHIINGKFDPVAATDYMGIGSEEMLKLAKDPRVEQPDGYYITRGEI